MFTISNILSLSRIVLVIPIAYLLIIGNTNWAIIIGVIAGITDFLDGYLARKLRQVSELGKILDPLADKIFVGVILIVLYILNTVPAWFLLVVISRDILILFGGLYAKNKIKIVMQSTFEGKVTFLIILLVILGAILEISLIEPRGYIFATAAILYSTVVYFVRFIKELSYIKGKY